MFSSGFCFQEFLRWALKRERWEWMNEWMCGRVRFTVVVIDWWLRHPWWSDGIKCSNHRRWFQRNRKKEGLAQRRSRSSSFHRNHCVWRMFAIGRFFSFLEKVESGYQFIVWDPSWVTVVWLLKTKKKKKKEERRRENIIIRHVLHKFKIIMCKDDGRNSKETHQGRRRRRRRRV